VTNSWVPASAASLVVGAFALLLGALLLPSTGDDTAATLELVQQDNGLWYAVAALFMLAACGLLLGLPSMLFLFPHKGHTLGLTAVAVFAVACAGTAGYAMILAFFRALVLADAINVERFGAVTDEPGFLGFLYGWIAAFYLGELLLGIALLRSGTTPRWIPLLLLAHVASLPLGFALPEVIRESAVALTAFALAGTAITANRQASDTGLTVRRGAFSRP
jgi:hypothetical protein